MNEKELLLTSILNCERCDLYARDISLTSEQEKNLLSAKRRREKGVPLQYIIGEVEFYGLTLKVDERVFIPRPETEILVEEAIRQIKMEPEGVFREILDIGTGSGCIAIALAKSLPQAHIMAVDISCAALDVAIQNANLNAVSASIDFVQSDLFSCLEKPSIHPGDNIFKEITRTYDMIISNPPYISSDDIGSLQKELEYEPMIALDGGKDGLDFYRRIIGKAHRFIKTGGLLLMEIGFGQARAINDIIAEHGNFRLLKIIKDYSGIERIVVMERVNG